nr:GtrA family protein [Fluoribacter dumoffii]
MIAGFISFTVNFCSRILYNESFSFSTSIFLAYITGMITAFILGKLFVFKQSGQTLVQSLIFFILVNCIGMLQTWLVSLLLVFYVLPALDIHQFSREIGHVMGLIFPVFTSYLGHKFWTFRENS